MICSRNPQRIALLVGTISLISLSLSAMPAVAQDQAAQPAPSAAQNPSSPNAQAPTMPTAEPWERLQGITVQIEKLRRTAHSTTTLTWSYQNTTDSPLSIDDTWTDLNGPNNGGELVTLIDLGQKKIYYPMTSGAKALGRVAPDSITLAPGEKYTTWIKFPALPSEVTTIDISVEGVATPFEAVPVTN